MIPVELVRAFQYGRSPSLVGLIFMALLMALGYFLHKLVRNVPDRVLLDDGAAVVLRRGNEQHHIALSNISKVIYARFLTPPRVTLLLRHPSSFGPQVTFWGPLSLSFRSPVILDLIRQVDDVMRQHQSKR
jgi:hypothetical protein